MKKLILLMLLGVNLLCAEVVFYGAYYGDIKEKISNWNNYPNNSVSSAGNVYLYKNKISLVDFIANTKSKHITNAIDEAKKYAKKNKFTKCAIDNMSHQVIKTENEVIVLTDYNVIGFN